MKKKTARAMKKSREISIIIVVFALIGSFAGFASTQEINSQKSENPEPQVTMDFKDADIKDVLRILSEKSKLNIITGDEVQGTITLKMENVPWNKALDMILKTKGYVYEQDGNIIRVTTTDYLAKEELKTQIYSLNYANACSKKDTGGNVITPGLEESIKEMLTERGSVQADERTNVLIVTDIPSNIKKIFEIIEKLDSRTPQIQIEARIIETTLGESENIGVQWQTEIAATGSRRPTTIPFSEWSNRGRYYPSPEADITYTGSQITGIDSSFDVRDDLPYNHKDDVTFSALPVVPGDLGADEYFQFGTLDFTGLQAALEILFSRTDTNVLSNPRITTLNNQPAKITVGTKWPVASYSYSEEAGRWHISGWEYIEYGILLDVTPVVNKDGYITLSVKPEVSDEQGTIFFEGAEVPIITTKEAEVQVMIEDGQTLVIGGLMKDKVKNTKRKIPILGDIPLLGLLFSKNETEIEKKDLLIFITPHILKETGTLDSVTLRIDFEQEPIF